MTGITMLSGSIVFMAWRIIRFQMEEKVTVNILNKQLQTAAKGWSSSLDIGKEATNSFSW
jgi:hypothetical protein